MEGAAWYKYANVEWELLALINLNCDPHADRSFHPDNWSGKQGPANH